MTRQWIMAALLWSATMTAMGQTYPEPPWPADADIEALDGDTDDPTGIVYIPEGTDDSSTPPFIVQFNRNWQRMLEIIGTANALRVVEVSGGNIGVYPGRYVLAATAKTYNGSSSTAVTDGTRYVYLDSSNVLTVGTAWPAAWGTYAPLAIVVRSAGDITSITDCRGWTHNIVSGSDTDTLGGLTPTDSYIVVGNGSAWTTETGSTARASLGLTIGTNVQAYDADLAGMAGLSPSAGKAVMGTGSAWAMTDPLGGLVSQASATTIRVEAITFVPYYATAWRNGLDTAVTRAATASFDVSSYVGSSYYISIDTYDTPDFDLVVSEDVPYAEGTVGSRIPLARVTTDGSGNITALEDLRHVRLWGPWLPYTQTGEQLSLLDESETSGMLAFVHTTQGIAVRTITAGTGISVANGTGASGNPTIATTGTVASLAGLAGNGVVVNNGGTIAARTITASTGISITNGDGTWGNPTIATSGTVASLSSLASNGVVVNNGGTITARTITASTGITVSNGDGTAGNPTIATSGAVASLAGLASNGVVVNNGGTITARTITAGSGITVTNGDGTAGNPTVAVSAGSLLPKVEITVGSQAGQNRTVTLQVEDSAGTDLSGRYMVKVWFSGSAYGSPVGTAGNASWSWSTGAPIDTDDYFTTEAVTTSSGSCSVVWTDSDGGTYTVHASAGGTVTTADATITAP